MAGRVLAWIATAAGLMLIVVLVTGGFRFEVGPVRVSAHGVVPPLLVMALTGVCNAVDRGLVPAGSDIVVHGSGWYGTGEYTPPHPEHVVEVSTVEDIASAVFGTKR